MNTVGSSVGNRNGAALRVALRGFTRLRNRHLVIFDIAAILMAPSAALLLIYQDLALWSASGRAFLIYMIVAMAVRVPVFFAGGLYGRYWRYATVDELCQIVGAVLASSLGICSVFYWLHVQTHGAISLPLVLLAVDTSFTLALVGGVRFGIRLAQRLVHGGAGTAARRVLIVGAGDAGHRLLHDIRRNPQLDLGPVGFIDDDPSLKRLRIRGLPVFGGREALASVVRSKRVEQVLIAIPSAPGKTIREYVSICEAANVSVKTIPSMAAILEDRVRVTELRNVEIEDLLGRPPIMTDFTAIREKIRGKRVLITGAGGSIGSELSRQVLRCKPVGIALLGHGENSIFDIQNELRRLQGNAGSLPASPEDFERPTEIAAFIADVRDEARLNYVVQTFAPDIIFHAAAHKHVPLMEGNPTEAIANNVLGTRNVLKAAVAADVRHLVMISTDKAVNPTSVMGATKRVAELLVLNAARRTGRQFVVVRFGNVLGSRGSVVPTFKRQVASGGPVTVSHPEMTRYFMSIPEAVQLVLQAFVFGRGGEVFMLDMGKPVRIADLARDLIQLSGLEVGRDIDILYTGVRPGEKLYEELFIPGERYDKTQHNKIIRVGNASENVPDELDRFIAEFENAVSLGHREPVLRCLKSLVPEFLSDEERLGDPREAERSPVCLMEVVQTHDH